MKTKKNKIKVEEPIEPIEEYIPSFHEMKVCRDTYERWKRLGILKNFYNKNKLL
jgi:hypothetical protein